MNRLIIVMAVLALYLLPAQPAQSETHFVSGVNDGFRTFAYISRNGTEFRTDELGPVMNQHLWDELSPTDRKALVGVYGWQLSRRSDHFGGDGSTAMADWINQEQGWTAAADALKARHAGKAFPALDSVFGPGAALIIPDYSCVNPEIANTAQYKEASRLAMELTADYAVGKQIYDMLANAKWDQISISVKTLSEPLIKMIVDNFITGFVTNGASKVSELVATAYSFRNDLIDFIKSGQKAGNKPPTPIELIERLEKYITDMKTTANTAAALVAQKKAQLQPLADQLKQLDATTTTRKQTETAALRNSLTAKTTVATAAASNGTILPQTANDATPEEKAESVRRQAQEYFNNLQSEVSRIAGLKSAAYNLNSSKYVGRISTPPPAYEAIRYFPEASDSFVRPYFEIVDKINTVSQWITTEIPSVIASMGQSKTALVGATASVTTSIDDIMPEILTFHANALWLNTYASLLQCQCLPSESLGITSLRDFNYIIDFAVTPEKTADQAMQELTDQLAIAESIKSSLSPGVTKRREWMNSEWSRYDSLKFNFDNSLSYVIAAIKQLDTLHSGPYFKKDTSPFVCYGSACFYKYSVDIVAINAGIAAQPDAASREAARAAAVQELIQLKAQEESLLHRLDIAQNSHLLDSQEINNFYAAVAARTTGFGSIAAIIEEFKNVTGKSLKDPYTMWDDLVPDITYYYLGSGSWIRNRSCMTTNLGQAVNLVSGKIPEYYLLLDLYNSMAKNKSYYMGLSQTAFDAFMTDVTNKIGQYPDGTYITAFKMNNVWGIDYPSWQLYMKTNNRVEALNSEYRYSLINDPVAWSVTGTVKTPQGTPVPGVTVLLNGYLTASTITGGDGAYSFDFIGSGSFTVTVSGKGYQFEAPKSVTVNKADTSAHFIATPTAQSGYSISGHITGLSGLLSTGITVVATSSIGVDVTAFTSSDGAFLFSGLAAGSYNLRPVSSSLEFTPATITVVLPASASGQDFSAAPAGTTPSYSLNLSVSGDGAGTISQTPSGVSCSNSCSKSFSATTVVTLAAAPAVGSKFVGWYGRCSGIGSCTVTMDGVRDVVASFALDVLPDTTPPVITAFSGPQASDIASVAITLAATDNVAVFRYCLTETNSSLSCSGWSRTPPTQYSFYLPGAKKLYAFVRDAAGNVAGTTPLDITVTARLTLLFAGGGHGTVMGDLVCGTPSCPPQDFSKDTVTLIVAPDADSTFSWSGCYSEYWGNYCDVSLTSQTSPKTVTLTFTPIPPIQNSRSGKIYATLMGDLGAYRDIDLAANDTLQIRKLLIPVVEPLSLNFDRNITVSLDGGKGNDYVTTTGATVLTGPVRIKSGRISFKGIKVQ